MRACLGLILAGLALALAVSGCPAESIFDRLPPEAGGLPANAPARPKTLYQYPAVHDMPPPRPIEPMAEEEQVRLEKELAAARDRQESLVGTDKPAAPGSPKKPSAVPPAGAKAAAPAPIKKTATVAVVPPADARAAAPIPKKKASTVAVIPPPGARAYAPPPKKKPMTVIVVPPAGVTANP